MRNQTMHETYTSFDLVKLDIKKLLKQCDHVAISIQVYVYSIRVYIIQPSCNKPAKPKDWTTSNQRGKKIIIR